MLARSSRNPKSRGAWAQEILNEHDRAFRKIEEFIGKLRLILSPDALRIIGYRLIQVADEIEPPPTLQGSVYGWEPARLAVRNVSEYRTLRLMAELDASTYTAGDIVEELQRQHVETRGGRLAWRVDRVRTILGRERVRRSMLAGIDAPGSPLAAEVPAAMSPERVQTILAEGRRRLAASNVTTRPATPTE